MNTDFTKLGYRLVDGVSQGRKELWIHSTYDRSIIFDPETRAINILKEGKKIRARANDDEYNLKEKSEQKTDHALLEAEGFKGRIAIMEGIPQMIYANNGLRAVVNLETNKMTDLYIAGMYKDRVELQAVGE